MINRYIKMCLLALCISLYSVFSGAFGCSGPADEETATDFFPETCAEIQDIEVEETGARPANGTYTLYVDGDESQPWDCYCHNMNRAEPLEFLTVNESDNTSQISNGTTVATTSYRRYRIDPLRLEIWPLDDTFATSDFDDTFEPTLPEGMENIPAGWAEFQVAGILEDPVAAETSVNLEETGFIFDESIDDDGYFCDAGSGIPDEFVTTSAEVASDLVSFILSATTIYSEAGATVREVADCTNLGPDFDTMTELEVDAVTWPLEYIGE